MASRSINHHPALLHDHRNPTCIPAWTEVVPGVKVCNMQIVVSIQVNKVRLTNEVNIDCNFDTTVKVSSNISMCFRTVGLNGTRI